MRKRNMVCVLAIVAALLLTGCSGGITVKDVQVSKLAVISGVLVSSADMQDVQARIIIKGEGGKVMLDAAFTLMDGVKANTDAAFAFNLFDSAVLASATLSYAPFTNIYASMVQDTITCEILKDGKAATSFKIDGSLIDVEQAIENLRQPEAE